ncbi:MAG TPA: hypothetical protein DCF97_00255, partial [Plesiomonas shigelloides]|nr:hypothetical protein [Plesiomonas shigelloides]
AITDVRKILIKHGLLDITHEIGAPVTDDLFSIRRGTRVIIEDTRTRLRGIWAEMTWQMQRRRDNPECADQEFAGKCDPQ